MTSKTVDSDHPQTQPQKSPRSYLALKDDPDPRSRVLDPPIMIRTSLLGKPSPTPRKKPKQHSRHVLSNEFNGGDVQSASDFGKDPNNVVGGLKAAINNPNVPEKSKKDAEARLDQMDS